MQTFLQNRPTYLTLLVLILCFIFCLAPLSAAAVEKPNGLDFAAQFDQSAPDNSARPPARPSTTRMNLRLKSMMLAQTEKTKKKDGYQRSLVWLKFTHRVDRGPEAFGLHHARLQTDAAARSNPRAAPWSALRA